MIGEGNTSIGREEWYEKEGSIDRGGRCSVFLTMQCFSILNDAIFSRCFWKNIDLNVLDNVWKIQNIMLTMHISDIFQTINQIPEKFKKNSNVKKGGKFYEH